MALLHTKLVFCLSAGRRAKTEVNMSFINAIFGYPLGWIMWLLYKVVPIYGLALILFTLIPKLAMVPLMIKQQKSMAKQAAFRPRMEEIQNKYKNNKEKMNEEMMKLYEEEGFNPMSGCLPMLIQFPILFGLIDVIYHPLKHIMRFSGEMITQATDIVNNLGLTVNPYSSEISVINAVQQNPGAFSSMGSDFVSKIQDFNFVFLGIDLSQVPTFTLNLLILIPILSGVTSVMLSMASIRQSKATMGENAAGSGMTNAMMWAMPLMSLFIAFQVPAGVGMYWILTNLFSFVQTVLLNKFYNPKEMAEAAAAEAERKREEARQQKIEAKKKLKEGKVEEKEVEEALSQKEINRRKLAEARRRDAERYGEEYVEVTDEDLK